MLANSNELIHFHSLSPLFMGDDMSWFCTKMSLSSPQPAHASSPSLFSVVVVGIANIYLRRFIVTIIARRFVIAGYLLNSEAFAMAHSNAFSRASKMVNMNNHMIIFPSSPFGVHVLLCVLCTQHTVHNVYPFFHSFFQQICFYAFHLVHEHAAVR